MIYQPREDEMLEKKYFGFREENSLDGLQLEFRFRRLLSRKLFSQKEMD